MSEGLEYIISASEGAAMSRVLESACIARWIGVCETNLRSAIEGWRTRAAFVQVLIRNFLFSSMGGDLNVAVLLKRTLGSIGAGIESVTHAECGFIEDIVIDDKSRDVREPA